MTPGTGPSLGRTKCHATRGEITAVGNFIKPAKCCHSFRVGRGQQHRGDAAPLSQGPGISLQRVAARTGWDTQGKEITTCFFKPSGPDTVSSGNNPAAVNATPGEAQPHALTGSKHQGLVEKCHFSRSLQSPPSPPLCWLSTLAWSPRHESWG